MNFLITHITEYSYNEEVVFCHNIATIKPRVSVGQKLLDYNIDISPNPSEFSERIDFFGNNITRFSIQEEHKKLSVTSKCKIARDYTSIKESFNSDDCVKVTLEDALLSLKTNNPNNFEAKQFILDSILIRNSKANIKEYALVSFKPNRSVFEATNELMQRIFTDFDFVSGFTNVSTPLDVVMDEKKGVCQDFAQIAIACIRSVGLPARYISGYIETLPPPGKPKLVGVDASHAWFAVFIPGFGWVDFDPTNNKIPENQHIVVGWGRDYYDVPPLKGVIYSSGSSKLKVSVDIRQYHEPTIAMNQSQSQ
ncbi:transglutaminase-like putative cysteine protease [Maribacter vaceletii]|uniref:Transglutaminase-like putative cysteine protease n=1 Tax=Maribacter vaceletii TaxID=1206816 RepID=A0A495EEN8_9FLAO|nr:transglutaminase family protein [Maribacter vaceletii]RKR15342.1 transglutaminase-like putative cysteine protease [Maribacter vaceletii]